MICLILIQKADYLVSITKKVLIKTQNGLMRVLKSLTLQLIALLTRKGSVKALEAMIIMEVAE